MIPNRRTRIAEAIAKSVPDERPKYQIASAILGVLGMTPKAQKARWQLEVTRKIKGDPWKAIVRTQDHVLMTKSQLQEFHDEHCMDVDDKGIPYFFAIRNIETGKIYVWFSDEVKPHPINSHEEKQVAWRAGKQKGISRDKLRYMVDEIKSDSFAKYPGEE